MIIRKMVMKTTKPIILIMSMVMLYCLGCTKMDHHYKEFLVDGEKKYVGKVDSVKVYPGNNRIKLSWKINPDPAVAYVKIFWTKEGHLDSTKVDLNRTTGVDTAAVTIDNLAEGDYVFNFYAFDKHNNTSVKVERGGKVYGERYLNYIIPTTYTSAALKDGALHIEWLGNTDTTAIGSIVKYTDTKGVAKEYFAKATELKSIIKDVDAAKPAVYNTIYEPSRLAIDRFPTNTVTLNVVRTSPNLLKQDAWKNWSMAAGITFTPTLTGGFQINGGNQGHAGVYQAVNVQANVPYTIDMFVEGKAATNSWFEVYLGTDVPVQGVEYKSGGNRIGLSTYTGGCANTTPTYAGKLSVIRCVGSGNTVTFPQSGTAYFLIRIGGASVGAGGMLLSDIELRGPNLK